MPGVTHVGRVVDGGSTAVPQHPLATLWDECLLQQIISGEGWIVSDNHYFCTKKYNLLSATSFIQNDPDINNYA